MKKLIVLLAMVFTLGCATGSDPPIEQQSEFKILDIYYSALCDDGPSLFYKSIGV